MKIKYFLCFCFQIFPLFLWLCVCIVIVYLCICVCIYVFVFVFMYLCVCSAYLRPRQIQFGGFLVWSVSLECTTNWLSDITHNHDCVYFQLFLPKLLSTPFCGSNMVVNTFPFLFLIPFALFVSVSMQITAKQKEKGFFPEKWNEVRSTALQIGQCKFCPPKSWFNYSLNPSLNPHQQLSSNKLH